MPVRAKLWRAAFAAPAALVETFADALGDAAALTILAPPRKSEARIEALFDHEPDKAALAARLAVIAALCRAKAPKLDIREVPQLDWLKKVAGDFPPFDVARWTVYGAQHRAKVLRPRLALQIDATSAFGTGEHPTTKGCLLMLDRLLKKKAPRLALDMGCGSGILAMAYAKAAHGKAVAVDLDPESVQIAAANAKANGLQSRVRIGLGNGYRAALVRQNGPYDLVMANIFAGPLCKMAKDLKRHLGPGGVAVLSGLLNHQANAVLAAHQAQGLRLVKRLRIGEWAVLALKRPVRAK